MKKIYIQLILLVSVVSFNLQTYAQRTGRIIPTPAVTVSPAGATLYTLYC